MNKNEIDKICKYVCEQLKITQSEESDRETLYFAVFWKMCDLMERKVLVAAANETKISAYRNGIDKLFREFSVESNDWLKIVDQNIEGFISQIYSGQKLKDLKTTAPVVFRSFSLASYTN